MSTLRGLYHLYYGPKLYGDAVHCIRYASRGIGASLSDTGSRRDYELDTLMREYPTAGVGDFRISGLLVENADGTGCVDLRYVNHQITAGKYSQTGLPAVFASREQAQTLSVLTEDPVSHLQVELLYGVLPELDIITRAARIRNGAEHTVTLDKVCSCCLDVHFGAYELLSFPGTHCMERQLQKSALNGGAISVGSRRGTSSHQYNPAAVLAEKGATETSGGCIGMAFVYSGSFLLEAEKTQFDQTRVLLGIHPENFRYPLEPGQVFLVPETILTYSEAGYGQLSHRFHRVIIDHLCRGPYVHIPRPVLINSWESAYMDFDGQTIMDLAGEAAELGIDMVVMDDGWFGHRNDDNTSLGDWEVNEKKLGCTLAELIGRVNAKGIKFGIWIEPEMVSEDSSLYAEHPDWALCFPGRGPVRSRNQLVLDFSREDVREGIFEKLCAVLDQGPVAYVKWDMNRSLSDLWSAGRYSGKVMHDYMLGVYDFMEKLLTRYPGLLLETCCSGGGRFDAGMLYYGPQIWCSDNTDALDRIKIQYGTSFFYPVSTMGAHVSACPNHQTGRTVSLNTRAVVAMAGTFGYELNPALLRQEERREIREQITRFKTYEMLLRTGRYHRLTSPFEGDLAAWAVVSEDRTEVLLSAVVQMTHGPQDLYFVKLRDLEPEGLYTDSTTGAVYSGAALMYAGYPLPELKGDAPAYQAFLYRA